MSRLHRSAFLATLGRVNSPQQPANPSERQQDSGVHLTRPSGANPAGPLGHPDGSADRALIPVAFATAAVYLIFGLITVFVQNPSEATVNILTAGFLIALGAVHAFSGQRSRPYNAAVGQSLTSVALVVAGAAVLLLILANSPLLFILIVSLSLGLSSILKILAGMRVKETLAIAKDWQLEGLIMTITAAALVLTGEIGNKAILGTLGGGAIITGVFLLIGAFTLRSNTASSQHTPDK